MRPSLGRNRSRILALERTLAIKTPDGKLVLPPNVRNALGIAPRASVDIVISNEGIRLLIEEQEKPSVEELMQIIGELQAKFAGQPSLEDDLYEMRREEEEHSQRKYGC